MSSVFYHKMRALRFLLSPAQLRDRVKTSFRRPSGHLVPLIFLAFLLVACRPPEPARLPAAAVGGTIPPPPTSPVTPAALLDLPALTPTLASAGASIAAAPGVVTRASTATATPPPTSPVTPAGMVHLATITSTPPPGSWRIYSDPAIPAGVRAAVDQLLAAQPGRFGWTADAVEADLRLTVGEGTPMASWTYALAAPFPTITDSVSLEELQQSWQSGMPTPLLLTEQDAALLATLWGPSESVQIAPVEELVERLWEMGDGWTIRSFESLTPDLKVLRLNGQSPLDAEFDPLSYPLQFTAGLEGDEAAVAAFQAMQPTPMVNRDPDRLTTVAMTGVTALVRATAYQMELSGILYPGEEVSPVLQQADIAHISNEVAFAPDCPPPNPVGGTTFCSSDSYFALLESLGTDVVEVTGNHVNDWGTENFTHTLDMYDAAGMAYFGGGRVVDDAGAETLLEHNGNRIAFLGCNPVGPSYAWSGPNNAGSQPCDFAAIYEQIAELRDEGYVVIATQQYQEIYSYAPSGQQEIDFAQLAEAGAAAVSGSQGHHAQGFAFHNGAFIHYGLGNLFFDQMDMLGTRQSFVDIYTIYDGRLLSVELWTGLIENFARPRLMTPDERAALLQSVFAASGW